VIASFRSTMNKVAPRFSTIPEISTGCLLSAMFVDVIRASVHDRDRPFHWFLALSVMTWILRKDVISLN